MLFVISLLNLLSAVSVLASPRQIFSRQNKFDLTSEKVHGVNIGGWLLLEPWITPSIFEKVDQSLGIKDEFTLGQKLGNTAALQILKRHWDTFVSLDDFQRIAKAGFNTVRIPIGYWAYETVAGEPYTPGAAPYLDTAIEWARETGLKVWVDLHGAPGSQNGFDNSGQALTDPKWQQGDTIAVTLSVLETISTKYAQKKFQDVVVGIELLNEPLTPKLDLEKVRQFYRDGYSKVRAVSDTPVMFHDGFLVPIKWNGFLTQSDNNSINTVVDHHEYQIFTYDVIGLSPEKHIEAVCTGLGSYTDGLDKPVVIGEWTGAFTDCATHLNGYKAGTRFEGTYPGSSTVYGSCKGKNLITEWDQTYREQVRKYIEVQLSAFEARTQGWIFWNFKTEGAHEWDLFTLLDAGLFPQPLSSIPKGLCG